MERGNSKTKKEEETNHKFDITDWLQYLEHESSLSSIHMFSVWSTPFAALTVLLAITILLYSINLVFSIAGVDVRIILGWIILIFVSSLLSCGITIVRHSRYRMIRNSAEKLLKEILIEQKYKTVEEIKERWKDDLKNIEAPSKTSRK